jgi:germination protein M
MRIATVLLLATITVAICGGCTRKEAPAPAKTGRISATKAFETYFGPAPTTDKGTCFAFVIYFPSAAEQGKVVPFPFFTFDEPSMTKVALERLMGGMDEKSYAGQFLQPFPKGTRLLSLAQTGGEVTADFSKELAPVAADKQSGAAVHRSVALTLMQFAGVTSARVQIEGKDLFPAHAAPPSETSFVLQPSPPRLLNLIASKEANAAAVAEVDALFDRPVQIKECAFTTADGAPIDGTVFHSMFDMAAVLKPKDPAKLTAGTRIRVRWSVVDKVGRTAAGEDVFPLEIKVHQD